VIEDRCRELKRDWYDRIVPQLDPDIIVLIGAFDGRSRIALESGDGERPDVGGAEYQRLLTETTAASVHLLREPGRKLVLLEPLPRPMNGVNPLGCLSKGRVAEECRYVTNPEPTSLELHYRNIARTESDVVALNIDRLVCPHLPICDPIVNGTIVKWDAGHLTKTFAASIGPAIAAALRRDGVLTRASPR
jgi:SGNH domain-containing protein